MTRGILRAAVCAVAVGAAWWTGGFLLAVVAVVLALLCVPAFVRTPDGRIWWSTIVTWVRFRFRRQPPLAELMSRALAGGSADEPAALHWGGQRAVVIDAGATDDVEWLAYLSADRGPVAVAITEQAGPATTMHLALSASAPGIAREVMLDASSSTCLLPDRWAALVFDDPDAHLPEGVTALTGSEVNALFTRAFTGDAQSRERWDRYDHGQFTSIAWYAGATPANGAGLLAAQDVVPVKRVTRVYRRQPRTGLLTESVVLTATCPSVDLPRTVAAVRAAGQRSQAVLTPAAGDMASSLLVGLGLGAMPATTVR